MTEKRSVWSANGGRQTVLQTINAYRDTLTAAEDRAASYLIHHFPAAGLRPRGQELNSAIHRVTGVTAHRCMGAAGRASASAA
jgi:hypothetical protein